MKEEFKNERSNFNSCLKDPVCIALTESSISVPDNPIIERTENGDKKPKN